MQSKILAVHSAPMLAFDLAVVKRDRLALAMAFDRASARSFDADGRMHVKACRISKANVCPYFGREIPNYRELALDANKVYMLYRDPVELEKAAPTFRGLQLLMIHAPVNANDAKTHVTVGTIGTEISFDGTYLVADHLTVWTKEGVRLIETDEASELSCSYRYRADMRPGVDPAGVAYDGVMRDIMGNHVALVPEGRAGSDVYVNDANPSELQTMKRPNLIARLMFLGVLPAGTYDEAAKLALDAKLEAMTAKDCMAAEDEDMEDDPENPGKKRKKANPGPGAAGKAGGALASDEQIEAAIVAKGYISKADADKLVNDAKSAATADAVAAVNALHTAREAVKPLVGVVALDSAEAVYKFALDHEKVALDGVHPSAYAALVAQRIALKTATPTPVKGSPVLAADAASAAAAAIPGLSRVRVA